jgi:hypothetical protein
MQVATPGCLNDRQPRVPGFFTILLMDMKESEVSVLLEPHTRGVCFAPDAGI